MIKLYKWIYESLPIDQEFRTIIREGYDDDLDNVPNAATIQSEGYFLTAEELEQFAREAFEAGRELDVQSYGATGTGQISGPFDKPSHAYSIRFSDFDSYWQQKKKEGEG